MEHIARSIEGVFRTFSDDQTSEQNRSETERGLLADSLEMIVKSTTYREYMDQLSYMLK
jgi:hypothetical protein